MTRSASGSVFGWLCVAVGAIGAALFAGVAALMVLQATARTIGLPVVGGDEIAGWMSASAAFSALPYAFREGALVRMELVLLRLEEAGRRRAELLALLVGTVWCTIAAWAMVRFVWQNAVFGERSTGLINVPIWPIQTPAAIGLTLLALAMAEQLWRVWRGERPVYVARAEQTMASGKERHTVGI